MALFEWNDQIKTGIEKIDDQHKKLIGFINELHDSMRAGKGKEVVDNLLNELFEYTKYHFIFEEEIMKKYQYNNLEEQKKAHVIFVQKIDELTDKYKKNPMGISIDVLNFLMDWIKNHIMKDDMQYVDLLKEKAI